MFSHITVGVSDLERAARFYDALLTPLGLSRRPVAPDDDEGSPGLREHYTPGYFGAYLRDPDGNKLHMVHRPEFS